MPCARESLPRISVGMVRMIMTAMLTGTSTIKEAE